MLKPLGFTVVLLTAATVSAQDDELDPDVMTLLKRFDAEFIEITPGTGRFPKSFEMGSEDGAASERPAHVVTFDYEFAIAKYEVPQNLYEAVMGTNPSRWKGPRNSVERMTRADVIRFCERITQLMRQAKLLSEKQVIRLPSEAEWEYCCRGGTTTAYSFGEEARAEGDQKNQASLLDGYAWHTGNAAGNDPEVGSLKSNPWGLYDVHGYLWEFVADDWHDDYQGAPTDGSVWKRNTDGEEEPAIVLRGGSWRDRFDRLRSAARRKVEANVRTDAIGFRCVRSQLK